MQVTTGNIMHAAQMLARHDRYPSTPDIATYLDASERSVRFRIENCLGLHDKLRLLRDAYERRNDLPYMVPPGGWIVLPWLSQRLSHGRN